MRAGFPATGCPPARPVTPSRDSSSSATPGADPQSGYHRSKGEQAMSDAVIVSTARTGIGKAYRGAFNNTHGATLAGHVIKHAVQRARVEPGEVEDVILGCAL